MSGRPSDLQTIIAELRSGSMLDVDERVTLKNLRNIADRLAALAPVTPVNSLYTSGERVQESGKCMQGAEPTKGKS